MSKLFKDYAGQKFNRWTMISFSHREGPRTHWLCRCDCGTEKIVNVGNVRSGGSASCGCLQRETTSDVMATHRLSQSPMYRSWSSMKSRCLNPNNYDYKWYGGRGITVCEQWMDFKNFLADMQPSWRKGLTIDRINADGNYEPSNCRWATLKVQQRNRTNTAHIDTPDGRMSIAEFAERCGLPWGIAKNVVSNGVAQAIFNAFSAALSNSRG